MQRVRNRDGSVCVATSDGPWGSPGMATEKYRNRFGHLAYCRSAGSSISFGNAGGALLVPSDTSATVYDSKREQLCLVPSVVTEAGTAWVSGAVHPRAMGPHMWSQVFPPHFIRDHPGEIPPERSLPDWPAESGGKEALQKILHRASMLWDDPSLEESPPSSLDDPSVVEDPDVVELGFYTVDDLPLFKLILPERKRQLCEMVKAMERVLELAFDAPQAGENSRSAEG